MLNFFKKLLNKLLGHLIEPLILRLDKGISVDEHLYLCEEIKKSLAIDQNTFKQQKNDSAISQILISVSDSEKKKLELRALDRLTVSSINNNGEGISEVSNFTEHNLLNTHKKDSSSYRLIYLALQNLTLSKEEIQKFNEYLIKSVSINQWAAPNSIIFGRAYLLLSLATSYRFIPDEGVSEYLKIASERILRIIEIKQENIINFSDAPFKKDELLHEQLRIINLFLQLSVLFHDLRFLNASLKANDRILPFVKKILLKKNRELDDILILSYYLKNIELQESQMKNLI